ncbi:MAG: hypothetical protein ACXVC6_07265 [Bacteroidia bacterium]
MILNRPFRESIKMAEKDIFIEWYKERFKGLTSSPPEEVWKNIEQDLEVGNWYKKEFEKFNSEPPPEVWNNIANSLHVSDWYKKQFEKLSTPPPEEVWNSISENLSVNEAWKNIEHSLVARQKRRIMIKRGVVTTFLLLLFISAYLLLNVKQNETGKKAFIYADLSNEYRKGHVGLDANPYPSNENVTAGNKTPEKLTSAVSKTGTANTSFTSPQVLLKNNSASHVKTYEKQAIQEQRTDQNLTVFANEIPTSEEHSLKNTNTNTQEGLGRKTEAIRFITEQTLNENAPPFMMPIRNASLVRAAEPLSFNAIPSAGDSLFENKKSNPNDLFRGFYAGVVYSANNIWLLNNQTFNGFKSTSFDQTNINSGSAYGIAAGQSINHNWLAELNVYFNSHQGQTYHVYEEGRYLSKNVSLNYTVFNLSFKQRKAGFTKFKKLARSHGIIAGINYGYLKSASNIYNERTEITINNYNLTDLGLRLGYGYELLVCRKLLLSGCLQTNIGLNNIYSGTELIPGSFNRTHNAGIGLELGIKYLLK